MKSMAKKLSVAALCALSVTFYAAAQDIDVSTDNPLISGSAHISSPEEAQELFFATELTTFFDNHKAKCDSSGSMNTGSTTQNDDSGLIDGAVDSAGSAAEGVTDLAQDCVGGSCNVGSNVFGEDVCYYMPPEQAEKLRTLHLNYIPVTLSIVNTSDKAIVISRGKYVGGLEKFIVSKNDVLSAYPLLQPLSGSQKTRTQLYAGAGAAMTGAGAWQAYKGYQADSVGKLRYVYAACLGLPGLALLYCSYNRYTKTQMPLEQLLSKYEGLSRQTLGATLTTLTANTSETLECSDTFVIPSQSVFCEMVFIDRKAYDAAGNPELTLLYEVQQ